MKTIKFVLIFLCLTIVFPSFAQKPVFKAGAATSNITPFLGGGIVGNYGDPPPAKHIHDELHARCLVLDDGTTKLAIVVVDIIGMDRALVDEAKKLIRDEAGIPMENIMVSAIHTHSATSAQGAGSKRGTAGEKEFDEYQKFIIRKIADGVRVAINNLQPAKIGWGVGSLPQHLFVRRWFYKPGIPIPDPFGGQDKVVMNPGVGNPNLLKPAGVPDPEVSFISVKSVGDKPIALLANYSLHYVGGVPDNDISADYFAVFADRIQQLMNADRQTPAFVGILSNGTSGDVNNIDVMNKSPKRYEPYEKMKIVAYDLADEVMKVHKSIQYRDWVPLKAAQQELTLKVRKPDQKLIDRANWVLSRPDTIKPIHRYEVVYANRTLQMAKYPDNFNIVVQAFRVGDVGIAAFPFETFAETGIEVKKKSPFKPSFSISHANGSYGYLPTPEQHKLGGYETWLGVNKVETQASVKIVDTLMKLFEKMK